MQIPARILHLEATQADCELVRSTLEQANIGFSLTHCRNGSEFLAHLSQEDVSLVLADNQIPGCDCDWLLNKVQEYSSDLPVIFVVGTDGEASAIDSLSKGAVDYVLKSNLTRLPATVRRALQDAEHRLKCQQAEAALRLSEARYQNLVDHQSDFITRVDLAGNVLFVNDTWCRAFGKSREEMIGKSIRPTIFPDDLPLVQKVFEQGRKPPYRVEFDVRHIIADGSVHWLSWENSAILDETGNIFELQAIGRDITEQKQTETALNETQSSLEQERNLLRQLIDTVPDYIFVKDRQGRFILSNAQHNLSAALTTSDSLIGKTALDLYPLELGQRFHADDMRVMDLDEPLINAERQTVGPDGSARWVLTNKIPLKNADNQIIGVVGISRNITERKRAEDAFQESQARFRAIFEGAAIGIALVDDQGHIFETNPAMERLLGYPISELRSMTFMQVTHPDDVDVDWTLVQEVFAGSRDSYQIEKRYIHKDGHLIWGNLTVSVVKDADQKPRFVIGMVEDITARKQIENTLAEERNLLRTLFDHIPDLIYIKDVEGRIINNNTAHRQLLGAATIEQAVGKTDFDFFPVDLATAYFADEQAVLKSGQPLLNREELTVDRAGSPRWMLTTKLPLHNSQGSLIGIVGISRDITARKQIEEAEREQRLLAEALRNASAILASSLDPTTVMERILLSINDVVPHDSADVMMIEGDTAQVVASHGYSPEATIALQNFRLSLTTPAFQEMVDSRAPVLIADTRSYPGWVVIPESAWVRSYINAPIEVRGDLIGFVNLNSAQPNFFTLEHSHRLQAFVDIVGMSMENARLYDQLHQHVDELALRVDERTLELDRAKEHVEAILDSTNDAILVIRADGTIQRVNSSFNALFGFTTDDILDQPLAALVVPDQAEILLTSLSAAVQTGASARLEVNAFRRNKTTFNADLSLSPIRQNGTNSTSGAVEVVCSIRDITQRKRVETELQDLNRLKTEFLSTAAHELRTPLASILGFSEIMLNRTLDANRTRHYLEVIHDQSIQLRTIIDELLDISRIESKEGLTLDVRPLDMMELIAQTVSDAKNLLPTHKIQLEKLAERATVMGDQFRLGQVLQNLLSNAIKYSPGGGLITIRVESITDSLKISVQDHGIGMTAEQQSHLFERFYRADASNTTLSGTGLGLAISKLIVELHHGKIWAESEFQSGTTVFFTLPLK